MLTLIGRARRRLFHNELFSQGAYAAAAVLIAFILVLLVGTQILDWPWMVLVAGVAAGVAFYRARKSLLTPYAAAQVVDRRLELADTISTAVYFQQDRAPVSQPVREFQWAKAVQVSNSIDIRNAVPYTMPRSIYLLAVLVLVAGSLFALRYGLLGRLDLQPPLARVLGRQLGLTDPPELAKNLWKKPPKLPEQQDDDANAPVNDPEQTQQMQPDASNPDGSNSADASADKNDSKTDGKKEGNKAGQSGNEGEQEAQAESDPKQSSDNSGQDAGKQDQKQQSSKQESNAGENSSLMNKAKDMLQNLLSSLKPPSSNPGNPQQKQDANNQQKSQQKQGEKNGQPQNGQKGDQSEGQQSDQGQDPQDQNQQGEGKNDSQQGKKQPGSGAGNQDGDKRIKQAEDVAAMGKITEILGKRSANISGEATVEVQSTSQTLKTAYTQGSAQHSQTGGEINRDEVPVAMQPFVQEYFRQARKTVTPAGKTAPASKKQL